MLVPIYGTESGGLTAAVPMHLACAVAKQWLPEMRVGWTWPNAPARRNRTDAVTAPTSRTMMSEMMNRSMNQARVRPTAKLSDSRRQVLSPTRNTYENQ